MWAGSAVSGPTSRVGSLACLVMCLAVGACQELDPVYTIDLCKGDGVISANCKQCLRPPFAQQCPQCQPPSFDPQCPPLQSLMGVDAGATGGAAGTATARGGTGGRSAQAGVGTAGNMTQPISGSSAQPIAGAAASLDACGGTCRSPNAACWAKEATCVECTLPTDCYHATCDADTHRCVECTSNTDCIKACDIAMQKCVDCTSDDQCTSNPIDDVCNSQHKCVDCDSSHGCKDPAKPACVGQVCVACDNDDQCRDQRSKKCLRSANTCVECLASVDCAAPTPACDTATHACVACLADGDCPSRHCVEQTRRCVECEADADCASSAKAHCGSDNTCGKCTSNTQCQHLAETPACDTASGSCVACVDDSTCGDNACIRAEHVCSTVERGSVLACGECEADTQCGTDMKCAAVPFGSAASTKRYCLYNRAAVVACALMTTSAVRPFSRTVQETSVDGAAGPYCAPKATCEAMLAATNPVGGLNCGVTDDCGIAGLEDGICNNAKRCTYTCSADVDCPKEGLRVCSAGLCAQAM